MSFGQPEFLYAFIAIPLAAVFVVIMWRLRKYSISRLGDPSLISQMSMSVNLSGRGLRSILWFVGLALLIIALSRPQWGSEVREVEREGIQIMVALDVSESMLAEDVSPNRLIRAKIEISNLMSRLGGDEIGLVLFSGASFIQFPLTFDYATARTFLINAGPELISRQGTSLAGAVETALTGFDLDSPGQKVIIIMSDGESHEGDPLAVAQLANQQNVIIYTVGFGTTAGAPIPQYDAHGNVTGFKLDQGGQAITSRLNENLLQQAALRSNGQYYRVGGNTSVAEALSSEISTLQTASLESELLTRRVERFQPFLIAALTVLALIEFIPDRVVSRFNIFNRMRAAG